MPNMRAIYEGLEILLKYRLNVQGAPSDGFVSAGHDEICAGKESGTTPNDLSEEDQSQMKKLGWSWDEQFNCWRKFV